MSKEFELVEKEDVSGFSFPDGEVLKKEDDRKLRRAALDRAIALGNLEHHKVKIFFEDANSKKMVHTTIWAVTEKYVVLKQNVTIPIQRIHNLEI